MSCFYCLESRAPLKLCRHCRRIRACSEEHLAIHRGRRGAAAWDSAANSACSSAAGSRCGSRSRSGSTRRPSSSSASNPASAPAAKCFPFKIAKIRGKGLAMVATRDIKPLELILEECPAVQGPYLRTKQQCLECYKEIEDLSSCFRCPECNFPMCGHRCAEGPLHSSMECPVFKRNGFTMRDMDDGEEAGSTVPEYAAISTLRALKLKEANPTAWNSMQGLMDHCDERLRSCPKTVKYHQTFLVDFLKRGMPQSFGNFADHEIHRVFGILDVNNVNLSLKSGRGTGLYLSFARINHSCICNTRALKFLDGHRMELRAATKIAAGEEITTQYVKPSGTTGSRRANLFRKWHFECRCRRCEDRTELGSFYSALACPSCSARGSDQQPVLPRDPLDQESEWECLTCGRDFSVEHVRKTEAELEKAMEPPAEKEEVASRCERILHDFSSRVHPNHKLMIDVQSRLATAYGSGEEGVGPRLEQMTRPMLQRKMQVCNQVLDVMSKVDPGYTTWRGQILWELTRTKVFSAKRDVAAGIAGEKELKKALRDEKFLGIYIAYHQSVLLSGARSKEDKEVNIH